MTPSRPDAPAAPAAYAMLAAIAAGLFAIRLTGLPNFLDGEFRLGASVLDVLQNGNWICPRDALGNTDKPPLLVWLAALAALPTGRVTLATMYLPSALATLLTSWLVYASGRHYFGARAGFLAALGYLLCDAAARQVATARWDALFTLTVALAALAAFRAWAEGLSWTWFWLAAGVSTLAKGPLGVMLAAAGLLAVPWERRSGHSRPLAGSHRTGILLYVVGVFGWFGLALHVAGRHLIDDMILGELFGHAVEALPLRRFYVPAGDYLAMATPWSIFACAAFVRVVVQPSAEDLTRRFERFLFCWFFAGLALFSASPHTAGRLLYPLVPAAALLGGRELDRWLPRIPARWAAGSVGAAVAIAAVLLVARYHHREWRKEPIQETAALTDLARQVRDAVGDDFPLTYVDEGAGAKGKDADAMFALQIMFDTTRPTVPVARAASLLGGDAAAFVVVQNLGRLQRTLAPGTALSTLAEGHVKGKAVIHLVANRPRLAWTTPLATLDGPLRVSMDGVVPIRIATAELVVRADRDGVVEVVNESDEPHALRIRTVGPGATAEERVLAARESWVVTLGGGAPPG